MKINYKSMYPILKQQVKVLQNQLNPSTETESANELPANFNQIGWNITIEKLENLLVKLKQLREIKGKRLTPQYFKTIYNRAVIGAGETDKMIETLSMDTESIDYESEYVRLNAEIYELNIKIAEATRLAEEAKVAEQNGQAGKVK